MVVGVNPIYIDKFIGFDTHTHTHTTDFAGALFPQHPIQMPSGHHRLHSHGRLSHGYRTNWAWPCPHSTWRLGWVLWATWANRANRVNCFKENKNRLIFGKVGWEMLGTWEAVEKNWKIEAHFSKSPLIFRSLDPKVGENLAWKIAPSWNMVWMSLKIRWRFLRLEQMWDF